MSMGADWLIFTWEQETDGGLNGIQLESNIGWGESYASIRHSDLRINIQHLEDASEINNDGG